MGAKFLALVVAALVFVLGADHSQSGPRIASGFGLVPGQNLAVHVVVEVAEGQSAEEAVAQAVRSYGAEPWSPAYLGGGFTVTGLVWDVLPVVQNYNPASEPLVTQNALTATHATWDGPTTSLYDTDFGGLTTRCPSLVRECFGPQYLDGFNDVAWLPLQKGVLGVTWFTTSNPDEADMALSTRYTWDTAGGDVDVETVLLHENGHVAGLGHAQIEASVMWKYYLGVRRALFPVDVEGITYLYPAPGAEPTPTPTPIPDNDGGGPPCSKNPSHPRCKAENPGHSKKGG